MDQTKINLAIETLRKLITNLKLQTNDINLNFTHHTRRNHDDHIDYTLELSINSPLFKHKKPYHISYYPDHLILSDDSTDFKGKLQLPYTNPTLETELKKCFGYYLSQLALQLNKINLEFNQ